MKLVGSGGQQLQHFLYDASGTIATGGTPQLLLAKSMSRTSLWLQNLSAGPLYVDFGSARGTAVLTNGKVTSVTITNAGFNFTKPPLIRFLGGGNDLGGGNAINRSYLGLNQPNGASPSLPAKARAVLTSNAVSSVIVDDGGANYAIAPYVQFINSDLDPYGVAVPSTTLNGGVLLAAQGPPLILNGTFCPTDAISIIGATTGQVFTAKWTD